jgi:addiction module HigA family antidote
MTANFAYNPHPGEILAEEFMNPLGISQRELARAIHVDAMRVNEIVNGRRGITADTDLRLARFFGLSEGFFLGLQADHDMMAARKTLARTLDKITPRQTATENRQ